MASVSVKLPDSLKRQIEERTEEEGYMNSSEYIRQAVREKIKEETQLYPDELRRLMEQGNDPEKGKNHSLKEVKEEFR
ncbi:MAG: ribbon-helix-helix domain-containing protein [Candidatus Nanohaloarchaea archaeon]